MKTKEIINITCPNCNREFGLQNKIKTFIIEKYKDAVWRFIEEHSRFSKKDRTIITLFKSKDKANFEGRVWSRYYGYERKDWVKPNYEETKKITTEIYEKQMKNKGQRYLIAVSRNSWLLRMIFKWKKLI